MRKSLMRLNWSEYFWPAAMVAASLALSLGFACATPFAAFAAISALVFDRRNALISIAAVWLANQAIGYFLLGYPLTGNSLAWGAVLGLASIVEMMAARWASAYSAGVSRAAIPAAAFIASFAVYELTLFAAASSFLGGTEDFTIAILGRVFQINAIAMAAFLLLGALRPAFRAVFARSELGTA